MLMNALSLHDQQGNKRKILTNLSANRKTQTLHSLTWNLVSRSAHHEKKNAFFQQLEQFHLPHVVSIGNGKPIFG